MKQSILIVAGEASGDNVGGLFCSELKSRRAELEIFGLGGDRMKNAGVDILYHIDRLAFLGFWEVIKHIPFIRSVEKDVLEEAAKRKPLLAVLIDYPGFNMRLAKKLKSMGIPVLYYVSPQVWAWGKGRIEKIKNLVDRMIVVFEFEKKMYAGEGFEVEYFGHPLLEIVNPRLRAEEFKDRIGIKENEKYIGLFPGSRLQEVKMILPIMRDAVRKLSDSGIDIKGIIGRAPGLDDSVYTEITAEEFPLVTGFTYDLMSNSELNFVASGTATLECAILGKPLFVLYKTSMLTYLIAKRLIKIPDIGLVNVVAGRRIAPEFVQGNCRPGLIAEEAKRYLSNETFRSRITDDLREVRGRLGQPGSSGRAAEFAIGMLDSTVD